jgi:cyclohexadienyl dehydratase
MLRLRPQAPSSSDRVRLPLVRRARVVGLLTLTAMLALIALPGASHAGGKLRIGTSGDYPPFSKRVFGRDSGPYEGFDIEVAKAFAADQDLTIKWVPFKWPRLLDDLENRRFDIAMSGVTMRPDRSAVGRFSVPVVASGAVLILRDQDENEAARTLPTNQRLRLLDHPEMRIAVNAGGHLERVARKLFQHAQIKAIPNNASVRQALIAGLTDAVVTDTIEAPLWLKNTTGLTTLGPLTQDRKAYLGRADRGDLCDALDAWLLAREADGSLAKWRAQYFGEGAAHRTAEPINALLASINERLALMPLVAEEKRDSVRPIEDIAQEQRVLFNAVNRVDAITKREGRPALSRQAIRSFYQVQIDAAKAIQRHVLAGRAPEHPPKRDQDLVRVLRPALSRISGRIAELLVMVSTQPIPDDLDARARREIHGAGLETRRVREIESSIALFGPKASP